MPPRRSPTRKSHTRKLRSRRKSPRRKSSRMLNPNSREWTPDNPYTLETHGLYHLPREMQIYIYSLVAPYLSSIISIIHNLGLSMVRLEKNKPTPEHPYTSVSMDISSVPPTRFPIVIQAFSPISADVIDPFNRLGLERWWPVNNYIAENHPTSDVIFYYKHQGITGIADEIIQNTLDNSPQLYEIVEFILFYINNNSGYGNYIEDTNSYVLDRT